MTSRLLGALALVLCLGSGAGAHEAASGWTYDYNCCHSLDCRPVKEGEIEPIKGGYFIPASGELVGYTDPRIRSSGDGAVHRCSYGGRAEAKTICLYIPAGS